MKQILTLTVVLLAISSLQGSQTATTRSVLGTVTTLRIEARELEIQPDNGGRVTVRILENTIFQRVAPGETNLGNAVTTTISGIAVGDRALVTMAATAPEALRIIVISATDIAKRDETDRQDWNRRGINGIVAAKNGNQIVVRTRTLQGEVQQTVTVSDRTRFRRYAPDSVKFADAAASKLDDISAGDQLRARGEKSPDGLRVQAEEVVFGTFVTRAGAVTSVDAGSRQITINELGTGRPLVIKLSPDSQIKQMSAPPPRGGTGSPIAQMVETMPAGKVEDIKPGTSLIVSSTKGAQSDQVTAILILANADALIRMLTAPNARGGTLTFGVAGGPGGIDALGIGP